MKILHAMLCALFVLSTLPAATARTPEEAAIRQVLEQQADAWNRHDLEGFMRGYWNSSHLTFFSGGTVQHGWDAALLRYRQAYQSQGRQMGKLDFSDLQIQTLGPGYALVRGAFHLTM
ncbi:MAG TPA: hypothetical protein VKT29_10390, partial [Terriglobales bacterium]|nr:hypothetical protein [Terriglobales bacterium]